MVEVTRTFDVGRSPESVLAYLEDFSRTEEWDPGTVSCTRLDDGPVRVGATWRNVSKFLGRETQLTYELTVREPDRVVFVGSNATATTTDDITVNGGPDSTTSTVTYHATVTFSGVARLAAPLSKIAFEKLGSRTESNLVRILGPLND